jgi:hypothetical protein
MESHFVRIRGLFLVFLLSVSLLAACAGLGTQQQIPLSPVPITEIKAVEGTWEGLVINARTGKASGRIAVVLTSHDAYGTYSFGGETAQGSLVGTGRVAVHSGRLLSETGQRMANFTLCLRGSEKVMAAHVIGKDGNPYHMELTQLK